MWFFNAFLATMGILFGISVFFLLIVLAAATIIVKTEDDEDGD